MAQDKVEILVADDDPNIRETLKDILEDKQYLVDTVKNGYELLIYLKKRSPRMLILDLIMPYKNGMDVISAVKCVSPDTKIIIYTGFNKYKNSAYAEVADRFLLKDGSPQNLLRAVAELTVDNQ